jgi:hypothetical protein
MDRFTAFEMMIAASSEDEENKELPFSTRIKSLAINIINFLEFFKFNCFDGKFKLFDIYKYVGFHRHQTRFIKFI